MRVAMLCPPWFPVPPPGYGGVEWIVHLLTEGLVEAGVEVTLFASGDSRTDAELAAVYNEAPSEWIGHTFWELRHTLACLERGAEFDVVHDHSGLLGLALSGLAGVPFVHTVHGPLDEEAGTLYESICRLVPSANLISISLNQRRPKPELPWLANVPNALDLERYPFHGGHEDYLLFLGRMSPTKGAHRALEVAREAGLPLKLAGKCREPLERAYFDAYVHPGLGEHAEYVGEVSHADKVELLQRARATLVPIDWEEPFGLVLIESLACGTPVIATRRGAVPEVIEDGVTGVIVDRYEEMAAVLPQADALDPHRMRAAVRERFTPERMVSDYLDAYERAIELAAEPTARSGRTPRP
jgi:glycosyltransferase involved in cell wall biosynthesis